MNLKILRYVFCTDVDVRNVLFGVTTFRTTQGKSKLSYKLLVVTSGPLIYVFSSRNFLNELGEILVFCKAPILDLLGLVYPLPIFFGKETKGQSSAQMYLFSFKCCFQGFSELIPHNLIQIFDERELEVKRSLFFFILHGKRTFFYLTTCSLSRLWAHSKAPART